LNGLREVTARSGETIAETITEGMTAETTEEMTGGMIGETTENLEEIINSLFKSRSLFFERLFYIFNFNQSIK